MARAGYPCRGVYRAGLYRERAYPRRAAVGDAAAQLPPAGRLPRRATGVGNWRSERAACDGYTPSEITVGGTPAGLPAGGAQKNIFAGAATGDKTPAATPYAHI